MLQQGSNQVIDGVRNISNNDPIFGCGLPESARLQEDSAIANQCDGFSMPIGFIDEMDRQAGRRQCIGGGSPQYSHGIVYY